MIYGGGDGFLVRIELPAFSIFSTRLHKKPHSYSERFGEDMGVELRTIPVDSVKL
jgi:hypothetical protein